MAERGPTRALKPWYRVYKNGDILNFHHGDSVISLKGSAAESVLPKLLPLLDGRHSIEQIEIAAGQSARIIRAAIELLERYELLMDGAIPEAGDGLARTSVFLSSVDGASITEKIEASLAAATVNVIGSSNVASELLRGLHRSGMAGARGGSIEGLAERSADLIVAAPVAAELVHLRALNEAALKNGQPWMQILQYDGRFAAIGPIFIPYETACFACYQLRRAANVKYPDEYLKLERAEARFEQCAAVDMSIAGLATLYLMRWIGAQDPALVGSMLAFAPLSDKAISLHNVLRVPRCPACSLAADVIPPAPWHEG